MPIVGVHHVPSLRRERYEEVVRRISGKPRLESPDDVSGGGLLVHVAWEADDGFWIVDVWESEDAAVRFAREVRPIAERAGVVEPLETFQAHTYVSARRRRATPSRPPPVAPPRPRAARGRRGACWR